MQTSTALLRSEPPSLHEDWRDQNLRDACDSPSRASPLGDFQLLGVHDTALVRPPKPVVDLVLHLRQSVARPLVLDAACCLRVDGEVRRGPNRRGRLYRVM